MPSIIGLQPHGPALKNSQYFLNKDKDNTEEMIPKYRNWQSDTWQDPTRMQEVDFRNQFKKKTHEEILMMLITEDMIVLSQVPIMFNAFHSFSKGH